MKLSREDLKKLIKECLVEIMVEGIGTANGQTLSEASSRPRPRSTMARSTNVPMTQTPPPAANPVRALFGGMKVGDANLAAILEQTTTQIQPDIGEGFSAPGEPLNFYESVPSSPVVSDSSPASTWESVAFAKPRGFNPLVPPPPPTMRKLTEDELNSKAKVG